jgi:flavin reductase (DIM6/NTAB) family NADH-FMN oxidoreductase RutF
MAEHYAQPDRDPARAEEEAGARFDRTRHGTPVLEGALAYLECRLQSSQDAGDHTIFIAEVEEVFVRVGPRGGKPLLFFESGYRALGREVE